jgi:hypothetical protein
MTLIDWTSLYGENSRVGTDVLEMTAAGQMEVFVSSTNVPTCASLLSKSAILSVDILELSTK